MPTPRSLRRLAGSAVLALALTAGIATAPASPAHAASPPPPIGSTVCHVSQVYGLQCGPVTAVNLTISFPGGVVHGVFRYLACASARDRGTAVFQLSTGQQVGTVFAGTAGCVTYGLPLP